MYIQSLEFDFRPFVDVVRLQLSSRYQDSPLSVFILYSKSGLLPV